MWKPPNPLEFPPRRNQRAKDSLSINVHVPANNPDNGERSVHGLQGKFVLSHRYCTPLGGILISKIFL